MAVMDLPLTFEDVCAYIQRQLGSNPTSTSISNLVEMIPLSCCAVIATHAATTLLDLTQDQKEALSVEVAKAVSSQDNVELIKGAGDDAAKAVGQLQEMFISLTSKLSSIDALHHDEPFLPTLRALHERFNSLVQSSKDTATKIAAYGTQFDTIVMNFCKDTNISTNDRKAFISGFIKKADGFKDEADSLNSGFTVLHRDFAAFEGTFTSWAVSKEKDIQPAISAANKELRDLQAQLSQVKRVFIGVAAAATLGVAGALMFVPHLAVPLLAGCASSLIALKVAGVSVLVLGGVSYTVLSNMVKQKKSEIDSLNRQISQISAARRELESAGETALTTWKDSISAISHLWQSVQQDAVEIKTWLEQGADMAHEPEYMKVCLEHDVKVYKNMAVYLTQYAKSA